MTTAHIPGYLSRLANNQLRQQILPVWSRHALNSRSGTMAAMDAQGRTVQGSAKGAVMNARALWSFSLSYQLTGQADQLMTAMHLHDGFSDQFIDPHTHLVHWQLPKGDETNHQLLGQTYALFALSQFALSSQDSAALNTAYYLKEALYRHFQREDGTYASRIDHSESEEKNFTETCNQLHVLEALTQYYLARPNQETAQHMLTLIDLFLIHIFPAGEHLPLKFNRHWQPLPEVTSIGHNFEAPFLVALACEVLNDKIRLTLANKALQRLTDLSLQSGRHASGLFYFHRSAAGDWLPLFSWWTQAEASNALLWLYQKTGAETYLNELAGLWQLIEKHWVDAAGEWHTELDLNLLPTANTNKGDIWRSNYHATRACVALAQGFDALKGKQHTTIETAHTNNRTSSATLQFAGLPF